MAATSVRREQFHRAYMEFFEVAERKRRWNIFDDVPWDGLVGHPMLDERRAVGIETFCAEELYLPDYISSGMTIARPIFGTMWFQICWTYEESKHGLALREYLIRSGLRSEAQIAALEDRVTANAWRLPFETRRQMAVYGALQEAATFLAYKEQRAIAARDRDPVLEAIFFLLSRDEAAHAGFYRAVIELEMAEDRAGTIADLVRVIGEFRMPGDGLIKDYHQRLQSSGAGLSPRVFLERAVLPLLRTLGASRGELKAARAPTVAPTGSSAILAAQ